VNILNVRLLLSGRPDRLEDRSAVLTAIVLGVVLASAGSICTGCANSKNLSITDALRERGRHLVKVQGYAFRRDDGPIRLCSDVTTFFVRPFHGPVLQRPKPATPGEPDCGAPSLIVSGIRWHALVPQPGVVGSLQPPKIPAYVSIGEIKVRGVIDSGKLLVASS